MALRQRTRDEDRRAQGLDEIMAAGQIHTLYQPILDLRTRQVVGHEIFTHGPPGTPFEEAERLFAVAERTGRLLELERLSRARALDSARRHLAPGAKLFLNTSARALADPDVAGPGFVRLVDASGLRHEEVVLEITERVPKEERQPYEHVLRDLKQQGFGIAIDDMGAGYSSLSALVDDRARLPEVRHRARARHRSLLDQAQPAGDGGRPVRPHRGQGGGGRDRGGGGADDAARHGRAPGTGPLPGRAGRGGRWTPRWSRERADPVLPRAHPRAGGRAGRARLPRRHRARHQRHDARSRTRTARMPTTKSAGGRSRSWPSSGARTTATRTSSAWTSRAATTSSCSSSASAGGTIPPSVADLKAVRTPARSRRWPRTWAAPPSRTSRRRPSSRSATGWRCTTRCCTRSASCGGRWRRRWRWPPMRGRGEELRRAREAAGPDPARARRHRLPGHHGAEGPDGARASRRCRAGRAAPGSSRPMRCSGRRRSTACSWSWTGCAAAAPSSPPAASRPTRRSS